MERVVKSNYTMLEYNTILSIIHNIVLGLDSYKYYNLDKEVMEKVNQQINIICNYYEVLKKKVDFRRKDIELNSDAKRMIETIFLIEYSYKDITYSIWKNEIDNGNITPIHMLRDDDPMEYIEDVSKSTKYRALSNSIFSDDIKTFGSVGCSIGIVYDFSYESYLGACEGDAQLEHLNYDKLTVNQNSAFTVRKDKDVPINSTILTYNDNYQMTLTKTPYNLLNPYGINNVATYYNEVGLDKKFTHPIKLIYYKDINPLMEDKAYLLGKKLGLEVEIISMEKTK